MNKFEICTYMVFIFILFFHFQRLEWHSTDADYKICLVKGKDEVRYLFGLNF
jgi:hypothetical protein